ncbi:ABC transporter ATP-binding protein [Slackia heliotrinireducens]|uniref:ABC transporter ATP-binding protein n=1 Tax=Slackia heliotrinireducens TaxID=84110 RepID=UPI0033160459
MDIMPCLRTEGLIVGYDGKPLIKDVNIDVLPGRIVTLIGPNGAGKSTILKTVTGYLEPLGGAVYLSGKPLSELTPHERSLQFSVLLTERLRTELLTCADIVETGRYPYTGRLGILTDEDRRIVRESMEMVHVWDLRDRDFMQISDGQRQRILLARAICQRPQTIVLDEPTNYLDIRYQIDLLNVLRRLVSAREVGVIMSLHELPLARKVSDFVLCVKGDGIVAAGAPEEIFVPEVIDDLYGLKPGVYDPISGQILLEDE